MAILGRLETAWKVFWQLGPLQSGAFALYQLQRRSGWLRARLPVKRSLPQVGLPTHSLFSLPAAEELHAVLGEEGCSALLQEAEEIVAGQVRLFGGLPHRLNLEPPQPLQHALDYGDRVAGEDIKWFWEPGRFGWAVVLARAWWLTRDERFFAAFWRYFDVFVEQNPCNLGPHWSSAQEVGLRLVALVFAGSVFGMAATLQQQERLAGSVWQHAQRILPTWFYAEAQHNNHALSEALGLFMAGAWVGQIAWQRRGWAWFERALRTQIAEDGTYVQQSSNYHRLMLQEALWMDAVGRQMGLHWKPETRQRLSAAAQWLLAHMDESGQAVNLGNNDGALVLPLAVGGAADYRPVAQAAAMAFIGRAAFAPGIWDEAQLWLALPRPTQQWGADRCLTGVGRLNGAESWATVRAVKFAARPAHADQLHVELWWHGQNLACDPGTYLYNGLPPWQNGLVGVEVHNGLMVDGQQTMRRAGRFLWLDWDQARWLEQTERRLVAEHCGYERLGVRHVRTLEWLGGNDWQVIDDVLPLRGGEHSLALHWLLPDFPWHMEAQTMHLMTDGGPLWLWVRLEGLDKLPEVDLVRAGERLIGRGEVDERRGWVSRIYGERSAALSLCWHGRGQLPLRWVSHWHLGS